MTSIDTAQPRTRCHNRVGAVMSHLPWYSFKGITRLAGDTGLSVSAISRLVRGHHQPLYITVANVVQCLEARSGLHLDLREIMSGAGSYPTRSVCELVGCPGCLPDAAHNPDGSRKASVRISLVGQWTGDCAEFMALAESEGT